MYLFKSHLHIKEILDHLKCKSLYSAIWSAEAMHRSRRPTWVGVIHLQTLKILAQNCLVQYLTQNQYSFAEGEGKAGSCDHRLLHLQGELC